MTFHYNAGRKCAYAWVVAFLTGLFAWLLDLLVMRDLGAPVFFRYAFIAIGVFTCVGLVGFGIHFIRQAGRAVAEVTDEGLRVFDWSVLGAETSFLVPWHDVSRCGVAMRKRVTGGQSVEREVLYLALSAPLREKLIAWGRWTTCGDELWLTDRPAEGFEALKREINKHVLFDPHR